jgi:predicted nucleic acid-binding protein
LIGILKKSFVEFINSSTGEFKEYLLNAYQNLTCLKILNLDPLGQNLQWTEFSGKLVLLDTNTLLAAISRGSGLHTFVVETLQLTKDIGVKLAITDWTLEEYLAVLKRADGRYSKLNVPAKLLEKVEDMFISSFAFEQKKSPNLKWTEYYAKMQNPIEVLTKLSIDKLAIEKEIKELPFFSDIVEEVNNCWFKRNGYFKTSNVASHDAYHLILVKTLREKDERKTFLGPNFWFLSLDNSLEEVNLELNRKGEFQNKIPASTSADLWLETITPFLSTALRERGAGEVLADVLKSQFATIPKGISPRILAEIQGDWIKYEWLTVEDIEKILEEQFVSRLISRIEKEEHQGKDTQESIYELKKKFDTELGRLFDEKMKKMKQVAEDSEAKITGLIEDLKSQKVKVTDLESYKEKEEKFKRTWRTIAGTLGVVLIALCFVVVFAGFELNVYTTIVFLAFLICGIILLLLAIAYEQVKAHLSLGANAEIR